MEELQTTLLEPPDLEAGNVEADNNQARTKIGTTCCISRLPQALYDESEKAYVPQIVSIGPFHRGKQRRHFQGIERLKWRYLQRLLTQTGGPGSSETWLGIIKGLEKKARGYYSEAIPLSSSDFAEMLLLDGCFLIALFLMEKGDLSPDDDDPIFKMLWLKPALRRDLLMLENQIPFFVLETLFDLANKQQGNAGSSLHQIALEFLDDPTINLKVELKLDKEDETLHLLHLLYTSLIPRTRREPKEHSDIKRIKCVTKLRGAGLKVKKREEHVKKGEEHFLNIQFNNGTLEIPPLQVHDITCSQFLNLIAFEQCYGGVTTVITAYAQFMDFLIDSDDDVGFLCKHGIIENWLGNDEEVAHLFNKLCRDVVIPGKQCYLGDVMKKVDAYCSTPWNEWRESFMTKYFHNPWAMISLFAAILLLILTIASTVMMFVTYFIPPA